jgi:hypothetical protein
LPHIQDFAEVYGPRKFVVLGLNGFDNVNTMRDYQNLYPDILMLVDQDWRIFELYEQHGLIPLNYLITQDQVVDYFIEGFEEDVFRELIEDLLPSVTVVLTPDETTVPQGGSLSFDFTLTNWESTPQDLYALTEVSIPGGTSIVLLGPVPLTIDGNEEVTLPLQHYIPKAAPVGIYDYRAKIGTYPPPELMDYSDFQFEVVTQ